MGTIFRNVVSTICLICVLFVILTIGQDDTEEATLKVQRRRKIEKTNRQPGSTKCPCPACMTGADCKDTVKSKEPKFANRFTFIEVNETHFKDGVPLLYNSRTYPGDDQCPCSVFEYSITEVEDVLVKDNTDRFDIFDIDRETGKIHVTKVILPTELYRVTIQVRNKDTDTTDHTAITVARSKLEDDDMYSFQNENGNGYAEEHHRHKRVGSPTCTNHITWRINGLTLWARKKVKIKDIEAAPDEMTFTLTQDDTSIVNMRTGTRVSFTLELFFPGGTTDISVELFTPDSSTTVMILCDVVVQSIGDNLGTGWNGNVAYYNDPAFEVYQPNMAVLDFGLVTNNESLPSDAESKIIITYAAVMIENSLTQNTEYYISAGAEFLNSGYIWVGQANVTAINDGDQTVSKSPTFEMNLPSTVALGSSHLVLVEMFLPYPYRDYIFKVFTPADTVGVMSVCSIWFGEVGSNFGCGNDLSQVTSLTEKDPQAAGNSLGVMTIGRLLNKASRDNPVSIVDADNKVSGSVVLHLYPDTSLINQLMSVGIALEVDGDTILIGSANFTATAPVTTPSDITEILYRSSTSSLNSNLDDATVGVPFKITFELEVPVPKTPDVATHYVLEIIAPFDGTNPIFSVCSFKVISVGKDLPCLRKDDLVTEYSSRVIGDSGLEADRGLIDLGYVTNLNISSSPDNVIVVEAILMPLASSTSNAVNSKHNVSLGITCGASTVQLVDTEVTIATGPSLTPVSNATAPSFTMSFYDGVETVSVTGSTKVVVDMVTSRNITYDEMDMEFLMPYGSYDNENYSYFHICRVDISFNGKNMPCMTPEWYGKMMEYYSQYDNYEIDRAKLNIDSMCNYQFEDDTNEDRTSFEIFLKVLDREDLTHMTSKTISTGMQYTSNSLWVGQLRLDATIDTASDNVSPTNATYSFLTRNTTTSPIPLGLAVSYSLLAKIGKGDKAHIRVRATAQQEIAHICTVRVFSAGSNLPCVADEVAKKTYTNWPSGSGREIAELDLGIVNNFDTSGNNMTANNYFDDDSMIIEILVRANPSQSAGTASVVVEISYDTDMNVKSTYTLTDFITTEDTTGISTTVTDPVERTASVGEITGHLDNTTDMALGEVKRVLITAVIPEGSTYDLGFSFSITSAFTKKLEICDAAIVSVGDNLPCIDVLTEAEITSSGGVYNDSALFNLGFTCSRVLRPGDRKANTIVFEAYVRLLDNGHTLNGETVTVATAIRTFLNTVEIDTVDFIASNPDDFVDRVFDSVLDSVTNETLISIDQASPLLMRIAENVTVKANITIPWLSVSKNLLDVSLPVDDSACLTISDIRIIGSVGRNVLCVPPDANLKDITYTPNYNASNGNSQRNYVYINIGIVTNTGLTHRRKSFMPGDDDLVIEFDIQMADCASSDNGKVYKLSIGNKVASLISISDYDIQVVRDGNEKPEIDFEVKLGAASTSTEIYFEGIVYHNETSTAECKNASFFLSLPVYQQLAPSDFTITSNQTCSMIDYADNTALLQIDCDSFFFTDVLTFEAKVLVNSSVILPVGFSAADSVAQGWVGTNYVSRYNTYDNEDWFPYVISGEILIPYSVEAGIADDDLIAFGLGNSGIVTDCQFLSTIGNSGTASKARLNNAGDWTPIMRKNKFAPNRHLVVYLGNLHKFSIITIQQNGGHIDTITEVTVEYTTDAKSWFGEEVISLGDSPSNLENMTLSGVVARGVRISITNDTLNGVFADVGVKFEFYGQKLTSDVTQQEACDTLSASQKQSPPGFPVFGTRSFVEDPLTGTVFVCDRKVGSKKDESECKRSLDGSSWSKMEKKVACMLGYESDLGRLYAYAQNKKTIMMREGSGSWHSVPYITYETEITKLTWTSALSVPEFLNLELNRTPPHSSYRIITWGATKYGMYKNNVLKLTWAE